MQYRAHTDFLPSLHSFYQKDGNYRKTANKILAAWAKSQHQGLFSEHHVFQGFNLTHNGENRINHCRKYDLHDSSRLVTQQREGICTFLFVGTHQEVDEWLDKNKGLIVELSVARNQSKPIVKTEQAYTRTQLKTLRSSISQIKQELLQYKNSFENIDIASPSLSESSQKVLINQFHFNNTANFKSQLMHISQLTAQRNTVKAIEHAEMLELFTDFLKLKVKYIATLKEYLEVSKNLH